MDDAFLNLEHVIVLCMSKPTITGRLRELLLASGPPSREQLTEHIVAEGLTKAGNPASGVDQRLRKEKDLVELPDGRFDALARRLEGSVQTYRVTAHSKFVGEICTDDLALLLAIPGLRWVDGRTVSRWQNSWLPVPGLPYLVTGEVVGFRVAAGYVGLERLAPEALLASGEREQIVIDELRRTIQRRPDRYRDWRQDTRTDPTTTLVTPLAQAPTMAARGYRAHQVDTCRHTVAPTAPATHVSS